MLFGTARIVRHLFAIGLCLAVTLPGHASGPFRVKTMQGKVQGVPTQDGKVVAFKGIPYAAPPVGNLRWQPPQPAARWKGVLQAKDFGPHCFQSGTYKDMVFHDAGPSEDCLTLNVWAPAGANPGSLPVMVWVYGGGFASGSTSENRQDGQFLAHRNVVIVSMNYRLGIFGFFAHPELTAESPHHASGNYGLMDAAAALAWVRNNIKAFGGNPANVTLFGESAGSFAVSALMASPLSRDLFAKAIGESGGAFRSGSLAFEPRAVYEKRGTSFAQAAFHTTSLADLRKLPAETILQAAIAPSSPRPPSFRPDVDGYFLPQSVPDIYASGKQAHVPLIAGWNANEGGGLNPKTTAASFSEQVEKDFPGKSASFLALYPTASDSEAQQSASEYAGYKFIAFSTWAWLEAQVNTGNSPVFRYRFDLGSPGDRNHPASAGAFHSDDIEYVFGTLDSRPDIALRPEDRRLSEQIGTYWTNFARTGNPNGTPTSGGAADLLPPWPPYNAATHWQVMHLDRTSEAKPDLERPRLLFLQDLYATQ